MSVEHYKNAILEEIEGLDADLVPALEERDAAARLIKQLHEKYTPQQAATYPGDRTWELAGNYFLVSRRVHEALGIFWGLYEQMLRAQLKLSKRIHKGMPLVWISDCFQQLDFPVHAKRYLMLTLCEDAIKFQGVVPPEATGVYFRLVWGQGLSNEEFERYAHQFFKLEQEISKEAIFPEALLQRIDDRWLTELPSAGEASSYRVNTLYAQHLLSQLGSGAGEPLELLAEYLMSCMPGCRTRRRARTVSTDYDIVCAMEGFDVDFRSELGRYFVCECKDWNSPVNFTVMAKFCRVLDSTKSKFGVLFSKNSITGAGRTTDAEREQLKFFQDRGNVIVVLSLDDLKHVTDGANLITLLRRKYETVRLDLRVQKHAL